MIKFIIKWGSGSVCGIKTIYKAIEVEAEKIDDVNPINILPETIKKKVYYVRKIFTSDKKRNYDYGSWTEFIEVEEIE